jgi:ribosomal protein L40E
LESILIVLLVIGIIIFIAYPLFARSSEKLADAPDALETLVAQRDSTYDAIRDLDFDFQLGKLSQNDYNALREKYKIRAAQILQHIDALTNATGTRGKDADARIEIEIAKLRHSADKVEDEIARLRQTKSARVATAVTDTAAPATDAVEAEIARVRAARQVEKQFCGKCGAPRSPTDVFCAKCGNKL